MWYTDSMIKKTFTQEETERIATLYREGKWVTEIARQFGTCSYIIARTLKANGFTVAKRIEARNLSDEEEAIIEEMYPNYSLDFIANQLHIGREVVTKHLRQAGITICSRGKQRVYHTVDGKKVCGQCKIEKSINEFCRHNTTYDGLQPACRRCGQEHSRGKRLLTKFGITEDEYAAMERTQKEVCAICGQPETRLKFGKPTKLAVDHNHKTGKVRELLCFRCNVVIGRIEENPDLCDRIKNYLIRHGGGNK
jgi:biotin operon repressor